MKPAGGKAAAPGDKGADAKKTEAPKAGQPAANTAAAAKPAAAPAKTGAKK